MKNFANKGLLVGLFFAAAMILSAGTVWSQGNSNGKGNGKEKADQKEVGKPADKGNPKSQGDKSETAKPTGQPKHTEQPGNGNPHADKTNHGKPEDKGGDAGDDKPKGNEGHVPPGLAKEHPGKGHAYGRERKAASLEMGEERKNVAVTEHKEAVEEAEAFVTAEETKLNEAKGRLDVVKKTVEAMKLDKKVDPALIASKEALIKQAEEKIALLESQITKGKEILKAAKELTAPAAATAQ